MSHQTPPGKDEAEVPLPLHLQPYADTIKAFKYRNGVILKGGKYTAGVLDEISSKLNRNKSVVVNVTGPPGVGKTWYGIAFATLYDKHFHVMDIPAPDPRKDHGQVCFEREHIRYLIGADSPLKRGQAILLDEAHFGMGSRGFQNKEQIDMVNLISAIRSKGFLLIIVTLHSSMLDKIPREFVVNYEFAVKDHGLAKTYFKWYPTLANKQYNKGKGTLKLPIPGQRLEDQDTGCDCPDCLDCEFLKEYEGVTCYNIRAVYERRKEEFINKMSASKPEHEVKKKTREQLLVILHEHSKEFALTSHDMLTIKPIRKILTTIPKAPTGDTFIRSLATEYAEIHPEVISRLKQDRS